MKDNDGRPAPTADQLEFYQITHQAFNLQVERLKQKQAETSPSGRHSVTEGDSTWIANKNKDIAGAKKNIKISLKVLRERLGLNSKFTPVKNNKSMKLSYLDLALLNMKEIESEAGKQGYINQNSL